MITPAGLESALGARIQAAGGQVETLALPDGAADALIFRPAAPPSWCVVLVHGGGNDRMLGFWGLIAVFLERGLAIATAHLPGHGAGGGDTFTVEKTRQRIDALVGLAGAASGAPRVAVLGQSMGGAFVLDQLARGSSPHAVVAVSVPLALAMGWRAYGELLAVARPGNWHLANQVPLGVLPLVFGRHARTHYPVRLATGDDMVAAYREALVDLDLERRLAHDGFTPRPTLLVHGRRDGIAPVAHGQRVAAALAARAELRVFPTARHVEILVRPDVVSAIADWLREL